jgi:hypothetical protein
VKRKKTTNTNEISIGIRPLNRTDWRIGKRRIAFDRESGLSVWIDFLDDSAMLTEERQREFARMIWICFKEWKGL